LNYIDIEKSYVYLNSNQKNSWRVSIKSILHDVDENTEYYLTKECRAETIGINPFDHKSNSEFFTVVDNKNNRWSLRNVPIFKFNEYGNHYHLISEQNNPETCEININKINYKLIDFDEVNSKLKTKSLDCLYSKIHFKYKKKNYFIFNKVEYVNFDGEKHKDSEYLQPIHGYVPFLIGDKVKIGYAVRYLEKNKEGELELKLRTNQRINKFLPPIGKNLFMSFLTRKIISFFFFPIKICEFGEKINIKQSKIEFFERIN
tara:strand:- start:103 stop:882 length:780 start_codon:yes stop_codon:yes gene_type:complete